MPFFPHNEINLYYEIVGKGKPLLLINGLSADTRQWDTLINLLKTSFKVISYDMRCAGQSDKSDVPFTISQLADEAYHLIRYLGYDKVCIAGFSMGGIIAMNLSLDHPNIINKMFLVATAPSLKRPYPVPDDIMTMLHCTDVSPKLLSQVYGVIFGSQYKEKVSAQEFIKFRLEDTNPQPASAYLNQLRACMSSDLCNQISKINVPTYIIVGDQDRLVPPKNSHWLNTHIIDSKLFVLRGIGHMIPLEATDKLAEILILNS